MRMSLVGNLEDIGLGDILQIVSLSRKSGVLLLRSRGREASIVFVEGQVVHAASSAFKEDIGDLLLRKGLIDLGLLKKILAYQRSTSKPVRIDTILSEQFSLPLNLIDSLLRQQIERAVYGLFGWTDGTFSFELGDPGTLAAADHDTVQFMLHPGIGPQHLVAEGMRRLTQDDPSLAAPDIEDQPFGEETAGADSHAVPQPGDLLFLIDDDPRMGERIARELRSRGFQVCVFASAADFIREVGRARQEGSDPVLLIDLVMPGREGAGKLGGSEVLKEVREKAPGAKILIMSDLPSPDAERRIQTLGIPPVLRKPRPREEEEEGRATLAKLVEGVCAFAPPGRNGTPLFHLGAELFHELGEGDAPGETLCPAVPSRGLHLLKGMLQELNNPSLGGGIILLVLRFASEFFNRAVVFHPRDNAIVGLGQFGLEIPQADEAVRKTRIPLDEPSVFSTLLAERVPCKVKPGRGQWDTHLMEALGGERAEEIFLGPILSEGKIIAVLYGDNLPEKLTVGDTEPLEIFLSQAGLAMEKAILERRLQGMTAVL